MLRRLAELMDAGLTELEAWEELVAEYDHEVKVLTDAGRDSDAECAAEMASEAAGELARRRELAEWWASAPCGAVQ